MPPSLPLPELTRFHNKDSAGTLTAETTELAPGLFLNADPSLELSGQWRSPPGRLLELQVETTGRGAWMALHVALPVSGLQDITYLGYACRTAGTSPWMIRPCLRSGLEDGSFIDTFFRKHILTTARPVSHLDALYLDSCQELPLTALWRELVFFFPCEDFRIHLHHLYIFAL